MTPRGVDRRGGAVEVARREGVRLDSRMSFRLPHAPERIEAGKSLAGILGEEAVDCLAHNIGQVHPGFRRARFRREALAGLGPLGLMDRGRHLARVLRGHLPEGYSDALGVLLDSLTPPNKETGGHGLAVFFYLPHSFFIAHYGLDPAHNGGRDPLEASLRAQYELTRRFTAEFSIRPFLIHRTRETLARLGDWTQDPDPHVRRWCSEGTRPRLPWGLRLPAFVCDPRPCLPILEALKDDPELYVRRSVANHLGDIGKDHPDLLLTLCRKWLRGAGPERRWLIRHALRYPDKKGNEQAHTLRQQAA